MDQTSTGGSGSGSRSSDQQEEAVVLIPETMAEEGDGDVQPSQGREAGDETQDDDAAADDAEQGLFTPPRLEDGDDDGGENGTIETDAIEEDDARSKDNVEVPVATTSDEELVPEAPLASEEQAGTPGTAADMPAMTASVLSPINTAEAVDPPADEQLSADRIAVDGAAPSDTQSAIALEAEAIEGAAAAEGLSSVEGIPVEEAKEGVSVSAGEAQEVSLEEQAADGMDLAQATAPSIATAEDAVASTSNTSDAPPASVTFASPPVQNVAEAAGDAGAEVTSTNAGTAEKGAEAVTTMTPVAENPTVQPESDVKAIASAEVQQPNVVSPPITGKPASLDTTSKPSPSIFASPATPKSALAAASPAASPPANDPISKQIALVLKINKELIRLCVDLQTKDLASDVLFKDAALRLQSNLAFLASIADKSTKSSSGTLKDDSAASLVHNEPFPPTLHAPDSQLPKLYQLLAALRPSTGANGEQTKRERQRSTSQDSQRKRMKEEPVQLPPQMQVQPMHIQPMQPMQQMQSIQQMHPQANIAMAPHQAAAGPLQHHTDSNGISTNGSMTNNGNPQQSHSLTQAFGPNAVMNLNALQSHYRGQPQAVVSYMEANVPGFRNLPIQVQLQQMTSVQNAAMQRQRQQSQGPGSQQQQQQQQQQAPSRRTSNVTDASNRRPGTPQQSAFGQMSSPAPMSAASPASHLMPSPTSYSSPQQQQNQGLPTHSSAQGVPPMMANMPAHIQQHLLQQLQQQQLHNLQMSNSPQTAFGPTPGSSQPSNGLTWPSVQQQQQQQPPS